MFSKANRQQTPQFSPSIIGTNCNLVGDMESDGEVHIDGKVVGDVRCVTLVIGEGGSVTGEINAETVRVLGAVTGQITAAAVELARTARILGDITHDSLTVEAGASVEGRFNRLHPSSPAAAIADKPAGKLSTVAEVAEKALKDDEPMTANVIMLGN